MVAPLRAFLVILAALAVWPLGQGSKPAALPPIKDDAVTAKDPVVVALDKFSAAKRVSKKRADWRTALFEPPKQTFDRHREYRWHLETSKGPVTIQLFPDTAPMHVTSVIYLTRLGFYDGLTFHRVVKGFMAQGGCPLGNGTGNPGYQLDGELDGKRKHDRAGILSSANEGQPRTDGSQFFLTFAPTPHLDGKHTVFGVVTEGMATVQALEACGGTAEADQPSEKLALRRASIRVVERPRGQSRR